MSIDRLIIPCRSRAIDFPSATDGTTLEVLMKWMFSVFRNSFRGRPAILIEKLSNRFHFFVVFPLVSSLKTSNGTVEDGVFPPDRILSTCG